MLSMQVTGSLSTCHHLSSVRRPLVLGDSAAPCSVTSASSGYISQVECKRSLRGIEVLTPEGQATTIGEHLLLKRPKEHTRKLLAETMPFKCQQLPVPQRPHPPPG